MCNIKETIVIEQLGKNRKSLARCKLAFLCYNVTVTNNDPSLSNVKVSVGMSHTGSRGLETIEGNSGITLRANETYRFKTVKLFFSEELFIESTNKHLYITVDVLNECPGNNVEKISRTI